MLREVRSQTEVSEQDAVKLLYTNSENGFEDCVVFCEALSKRLGGKENFVRARCALRAEALQSIHRTAKERNVSVLHLHAERTAVWGKSKGESKVNMMHSTSFELAYQTGLCC